MNDLQENFPRAQQLTVPEALQRAYAYWNAGKAVQAEELCRHVLLAWPYQSDAMHLLGLIAHAYGRLDMAVSHIRQACQAANAPAIYFSNLAEMCRQKGLLVEAEQAAQRAVRMAPQLVDAWNNLGIILQESGKLEASLDCLQRVLVLQPNDARGHNNLANTWRRMSRLEQAEQHYKKALELDPNYAEAHSNLAFLLNTHGKFDEAAAAARHAIDLNPKLVDAYLNLADVEVARLRYADALHSLDMLYSFAPQHIAGLTARAQILKKMERNEEALAWANRAVLSAPDHANAHHTLGQVLQALGRHDEALHAFDQAVLLPGNVAEEALLARAALFMESGRSEDAIIAFDQVLQQFPASIRALTARNDTKVYQADDPDINMLEAALVQAGSLPLLDRTAAHFALGKAYLDTGNSARAFHHLHAANGLKRATFTYDSVATRQWMERIATTFTTDLKNLDDVGGAPSDLPVFIVGMPRSGTTLVEQILASHPQVHGAGELSALRLAIEAAGAFPPDLATMPADRLRAIGQDYLRRVAPFAHGKDRLVDKMPANFLYAGLIPMILSGARIIHCRRDPVDTCLSCYSKHFVGEQLFTYDLTELGEFHRAYQILMSQLRQVLPADRFIEVDYEAVVDNLEAEAQRLVAFIGLPWDEACLQFHKTRRVVRTASVNQVRQPIYKTSKGRWQKHAAYLGPLLAALGIGAA
ncbi:sulfotransferase [Herminiimonas glaciei]|uniref:Sulfotransferase n=1 Tax=Herminiimonas glaciei TaxID=523788 RepID=A0ABW2IG29_9BURK